MVTAGSITRQHVRQRRLLSEGSKHQCTQQVAAYERLQYHSSVLYETNKLMKVSASPLTSCSLTNVFSWDLYSWDLSSFMFLNGEG